MVRIFTNGPRLDFVLKPFEAMAGSAARLFLAAPYFTKPEPILEAVQAGKRVQLIVGLNSSTSPDALKRIHEVPGVDIRYFTDRFHAKIYIFDEVALLGSSNLTDNGLMQNREAVIRLDQADDRESIEEIQALFAELWEAARILTKDKLIEFGIAYRSVAQKFPDLDKEIEKEIGKAEAPNINVGSRQKSRERIFLEGLRSQIFEQYRPAFTEVTALLEELHLRRPGLADLGVASETNRFLNWVRLSYAVGEGAWHSTPLRSPADRRAEIEKLGQEWVSTDNDCVTQDFADRIHTVERVFGTPEAIEAGSKEEISAGLIALHAFHDQMRFVKGGEKNLMPEFWKLNGNDLARVKASLSYLVHGPGEFVQRLHDLLYDPHRKIRSFGMFCALELYGTLKPAEFPPMNGRIARALRYIGFDVKG